MAGNNTNQTSTTQTTGTGVKPRFLAEALAAGLQTAGNIFASKEQSKANKQVAKIEAETNLEIQRLRNEQQNKELVSNLRAALLDLQQKADRAVIEAAARSPDFRNIVFALLEAGKLAQSGAQISQPKNNNILGEVFRPVNIA